MLTLTTGFIANGYAETKVDTTLFTATSSEDVNDKNLSAYHYNVTYYEKGDRIYLSGADGYSATNNSSSNKKKHQKKGLLLQQELLSARNSTGYVTFDGVNKTINDDSWSAGEGGMTRDESYFWINSHQDKIGITASLVEAKIDPEYPKQVQYYVDGKWAYANDFKSADDAQNFQTYIKKSLEELNAEGKTVRFEFSGDFLNLKEAGEANPTSLAIKIKDHPLRNNIKKEMQEIEEIEKEISQLEKQTREDVGPLEYEKIWLKIGQLRSQLAMKKLKHEQLRVDLRNDINRLIKESKTFVAESELSPVPNH